MKLAKIGESAQNSAEDGVSAMLTSLQVVFYALRITLPGTVA
ncbi:hypothetical protein [Desulfovibrio sp. JC022]|nr:hypothetical protein [Desulfovibrio sp. JC022]